MRHVQFLSYFASNLYILGWQRVSSYDQISSLRSTSHHVTTSNPYLLLDNLLDLIPVLVCQKHERLLQTLPMIFRFPCSIKPTLSILDIMKGVSARLDENAGVRPRKELNPGGSSCSRAKKRTRGVSLGGTSELQAASATGIVKKGRVDELRTSDTLTWDEGKGDGRATSEDGNLDSEVKGRSLQAHSSLPEIPSRSDLKRSLSSRDVSFMDVDNKDDDMDVEIASASAISSSSNPDT